MSSYPNSLDAFLPPDFNPEEHAAADGGTFEPIPDGDYQAVIKKVDMKPTKTVGGMMLSVGAQVTGPKYAGKWVWQNINIKNANATAQKIGLQQFGALCVATGFSRPPRDTSEFVERPVCVRVITEEFGGRRENHIKAIKPPTNAVPRSAAAFAQPQPVQAQPVQAQQAPVKKSPWGV